MAYDDESHVTALELTSSKLKPFTVCAVTESKVADWVSTVLPEKNSKAWNEKLFKGSITV